MASRAPPRTACLALAKSSALASASSSRTSAESCPSRRTVSSRADSRQLQRDPYPAPCRALRSAKARGEVRTLVPPLRLARSPSVPDSWPHGHCASSPVSDSSRRTTGRGWRTSRRGPPGMARHVLMAVAAAQSMNPTPASSKTTSRGRSCRARARYPLSAGTVATSRSPRIVTVSTPPWLVPCTSTCSCTVAADVTAVASRRKVPHLARCRRRATPGALRLPPACSVPIGAARRDAPARHQPTTKYIVSRCILGRAAAG